MRSIAITGGSGFIGGAIRRRALVDRRAVRLLGRSRPSGGFLEKWERVDLTEEAALSHAVEGAAALIHAAPYIGSDLQRSLATNVEGTRRLVAGCREAGLTTIVYVSTTGVYGLGPHRGTSEDAHPKPASALSQARLEAEQIVLAAGGVVIRPHLVYGPGDRRVLPSIWRATEIAGGLIEEGNALISILSTDALAVQVWHVVDSLLSGRVVSPLILNAASGSPSSVRVVVDALVRATGSKRRLPSVSLAKARPLLLNSGFSIHQIEMIAHDNWFKSALPTIAGKTWLDAPGFGLTIEDEAWYRETLAPFRR
ncbi:MAG: hypothetical protein B5766_12780 [Candidatus Lumbricidophila eiseniae]|uniref:NAD-dependent epimerase/dehydratase domain-containing protein n=1 Tax=Candidatus Lumbricidiphila eiseniae TaxID=1969409 RepID=A0A2A6FMJ9_9MICO|nr:MAG: hypothetical protein B5766_12780 [Candidatus Lumbricidophila eiseniae]